MVLKYKILRERINAFGNSNLTESKQHKPNKKMTALMQSGRTVTDWLHLSYYVRSYMHVLGPNYVKRTENHRNMLHSGKIYCNKMQYFKNYDISPAFTLFAKIFLAIDLLPPDLCTAQITSLVHNHPV